MHLFRFDNRGSRQLFMLDTSKCLNLQLGTSSMQTLESKNSYICTCAYAGWKFLNYESRRIDDDMSSSTTRVKKRQTQIKELHVFMWLVCVFCSARVHDDVIQFILFWTITPLQKFMILKSKSNSSFRPGGRITDGKRRLNENIFRNSITYEFKTLI